MKPVTVLLAVLAASANASTYLFRCKANAEGKNVTVKFQVSDLLGSSPSLETYPGRPEDEPIVVTPKTSALTELNDNLDFSVGEKELDIAGDSDGVYQVGLALYRDSGFTRGFVRARGDVEFYAKATCKIKTQ